MRQSGEGGGNASCSVPSQRGNATPLPPITSQRDRAHTSGNQAAGARRFSSRRRCQRSSSSRHREHTPIRKTPAPHNTHTHTRSHTQPRKEASVSRGSGRVFLLLRQLGVRRPHALFSNQVSPYKPPPRRYILRAARRMQCVLCVVASYIAHETAWQARRRLNVCQRLTAVRSRELR